MTSTQSSFIELKQPSFQESKRLRGSTPGAHKAVCHPGFGSSLKGTLQKASLTNFAACRPALTGEASPVAIRNRTSISNKRRRQSATRPPLHQQWRRSEYRRQNLQADEEYRQVCRDSSRKWQTIDWTRDSSELPTAAHIARSSSS